MSNETTYRNAIARHGNNFSESEFLIGGGNSLTNFDYDFFVEFLKWREWHGKATLITSAYRPGDTGSAHSKGLAFDVILFNEWLQKPVEPRQLWLLATTWPFFGVGIYFDWTFVNTDGQRKQAVGLHLDRHTRSRPLRWLRVAQEFDGQTRNLYHYQNTTNGRFYNSKIQQTLELAHVIEKQWKGQREARCNKTP